MNLIESARWVYHRDMTKKATTTNALALSIAQDLLTLALMEMDSLTGGSSFDIAEANAANARILIEALSAK